MFEASIQGLTSLFTPTVAIYMFLGVLWGLLIGILPALGGITAMALMLPFAVTAGLEAGISLLLGAHIGTIYGDAACSILFKVPGSGKAIVHCFDGYPMTQQGQGARALGATATSAFIGGIIGAVALTLTLPLMRAFMLALGPPEYFMMGVWGLSVIAVFAEGSVLKGLVAAGLGLMVSFIGQDPVTATLRYTFGNLYLMDGLSFPVVAVGLFAISQVMSMHIKGGSIMEKGVNLEGSSVWQGMRDVFDHWPLVVRSSILGLWIGALPGIGNVVGTMAAYGQAVQTSKHPEKFGKGNVEGVIAPTSTMGANEGGALMPTLGFGIPGGETMAILLSAFIVLGIAPGRDMLEHRLPLVFSMVWMIVIANMLTTAIGILTAPQLAKIATLPGHVIIPLVLAVSVVGAYSMDGAIESVVVAVIFGFLGYFMDKYDFSKADFAIGMVLGLLIEQYMQVSITTYGNLFVITRPVSLAMLLGILFTLIWPVVNSARKRRKAKEAKLSGGMAK